MTLLVVTFVVSTTVIALTSFGLRATALGVTLLGLSVRPFELLSFGSGAVSSTTIAPSRAALYTTTAALLVGVAFTGRRRVVASIPRSVAFIGVASLAIAILQRDLPPWVISGIVQWCLFALAWGLGSVIAERVRTGEIDSRTMVTVLTVPVACHAAFALMQFVGLGHVNIVSVGEVGTIERVTGLAGHPGNLGKILVLLMVMILPFTRSRDSWTARTGNAGILLCCVVMAATFSRANVAATIGLLGIWYMLGPGGSSLRRLAIPALGGLAALPVLDVLLARQAHDSEGGSRPALEAAAYKQIRQTFFFGVGPNDYLPTVAKFDRLAAGGLPVHSTFLLILAELGFVVSLLLLWPLAMVVIKAVRYRNLPTFGGLQAAAVVAATPGVIVILWTGHGMISRVVGLLAFFAVGYVFRLVVAAGSEPVPPAIVRVSGSGAVAPSRYRPEPAVPSSAAKRPYD